MKILVLNGCGKEDLESDLVFQDIVEEFIFQGNDVNAIFLRDLEIKRCIGCFSCWVNSPGKCIFRDEMDQILEQFIQSDMVVYYTPIRFGGYSHLIKNVLDRLLPLYVPTMNKKQGEVHNKARYDHYPYLMVLGYQNGNDLEEIETFMDLVSKNAMNMWHSGHLVFTIQKELGIDNIEKERKILPTIPPIIS